MTDLMELASRVEAGEGGDRRIDYRVYSAMDGRPVIWDDDGRFAYTSSIEWATKLLPAAFDHMEVHPPRGKYTGWTIHIIPPSRAMFDTCTGYAPSYERALTAACLRARAHQGTAHVGQ